jgi:hypothetical protein
MGSELNNVSKLMYYVTRFNYFSVTMAKSIGNGYPLAAVVTTPGTVQHH